MTPNEKRIIAEFIENDCRDNPSLFNDIVLRGLPLWSGKDRGYYGQREWLELILKYHALCLVAGNNLGKSVVSSQVLIPWWACTRPNSLVVVYAPSISVLQENTWAGLRRAFEGYSFNGVTYKPALNLGAKISKGGNTMPTVELPNGSRIIGIATDKEERCSGYHNPELLVVTEESSGIKDFVWSAIAGLGPRKLWMVGNPLSANCGFYQKYKLGLEHSKLETPPEFATYSAVVPSLASPHIDRHFSPWGIADKTWHDNFLIEHGAQSYQYRTKVLAQFPEASAEVVIDPDALAYSMSEQARLAAAEFRARHQSKIIISADVGLGVGKSKSVILVRDDFGVLELVGEDMGVHDTADRMAHLKAKYGVSDAQLSYDSNGDVGRRMGEALRDKGVLNAWEYFGGDTSVDLWGRYYANARSATAYTFARRLRREHFAGIPKDAPFHIPADHPHAKLFVEEFKALRGVYRGDGKTALEDKNEYAARLKRSPDFMDAFSQGFLREARRR